MPIGLLAKIPGYEKPDLKADREMLADKARVEFLAMEAVMKAERKLGNDPKDVGKLKLGYDIESRTPTGKLRFIEVKGRVVGAKTVTVTKNEILRGLNKKEDFILAIVEIDGDNAKTLCYVPFPFFREPDFGVSSVNYNIDELIVRGEFLV